jgi:signal transduction histidine kinase
VTDRIERHAQFRFATDILRRLGEELNPSIDQGILELVKNAYDADARRCTVVLARTNRPNGTITVSDNGDGMTADEIINGWLTLGRSGKSARSRTRLNRIPAGSKGLGRLAALRLGKVASLTTWPREDRRVELAIDISWDAYDRANVIDDVTLTLFRRAREPGQSNGTEVRLTGVRQSIGRMDVKRLARAMILLANPFDDDPQGFQPILKAPEFKDLERIVRNRYFEDADYHLVAKVDDDGKATAQVRDWRGQVLFTAEHGDIAKRRGGDVYSCPAAAFDLWAFILNRESFALKQSTQGEVRTWLDAFGGVHLYVNGLRVAPYGNQGNDWLDMNLRRVRSPEERPGTNTSIGRVRVEDTEDALLQKTDRTGLIETEEFLNLRAFAQDALDWMARRRLQEAEHRRQRERTRTKDEAEDARRELQATIESTGGQTRTALERGFKRYEARTQKRIKALRDEIQLYRTLSTAGITAATFAHESSGNPIKVIRQNVKVVERRGRELLDDRYDQSLGRPVAGISRAVESLSVLTTATLRLVDHEKRRPSRVDLHAVISGVLTTFRPFLLGRDVTLRRRLAEGHPYLLGTEAAIESILTNLLNNSLAAFERAEVSRRIIEVRTELLDDALALRVLDSGPGILDISLEDIWLPGESRTGNGTGLGLTIVRDAASDLGGDVDAVAHSKLGGAELIVVLPILGY